MYQMDHVERVLGEPQANIRHWLKEFNLAIKLRKGHSGRGYRLFTKQDIERLEYIRYLLHVRCFTYKGAKREFRRYMEYREEITNMLRVG